MSVLAYYVRLSEQALTKLQASSDWLSMLDNNGVSGAHLMDIGKACDGIVWLLSRMPPPALPPVEGSGFVVRKSLARLMSGAGGTKQRSLEGPLGPASLLSPEQVEEFSRWIGSLDVQQLRMQYDAKAMASAEVYPQIWVEEGDAAFDDYLRPRFERLRAFFAEAVAEKQSVLMFFS